MRGKIGVLRYFFNDVFVCLSLLFDSSDKVKGSLQTAMTLLFTLLEIELSNTFRVIINMQKSRHSEHLLKKNMDSRYLNKFIFIYISKELKDKI